MSTERYQQIDRTFIRENREIIESKTPIIISGIPGNLATLIAEAVEKSDDLFLMNTALTSPRHEGQFQAPFNRKDSQNNFDFSLISSQNSKSILKNIKETYPNLIIVDTTNPDAANPNAELYTKVGIPFVMGTTGGDRQKLNEIVKNSEINAVIDVNMAPHIVFMKALLEEATKKFTQVFPGWEISIIESHQAKKKDISGTAKAWLDKFLVLGARLIHPIKSIRDPKEQAELGIKNLEGHAYHWFKLTSPDGMASLEICTTVEGRAPYVCGTLMAIKHLEKKMKTQEKGQVYSMDDVLAG